MHKYSPAAQSRLCWRVYSHTAFFDVTHSDNNEAQSDRMSVAGTKWSKKRTILKVQEIRFHVQSGCENQDLDQVSAQMLIDELVRFFGMHLR